MKSYKKILFLLFILLLNSINISFSQLVSDYRVNDDSTSIAQFQAQLDVDGIGNYSVVWRDQRNSRLNVYCQRFDLNGVFLGNNFRVNTNPDSSGGPSIAITESGKIGISWVEINSTIPNSSKIKFRLFDSDGEPLTDEKLISDSLGYIDGVTTMEVSKEFIISWEQKGIRFQRLDSAGNKIGLNVKVNDYTGFSGTGNPSITIRSDDSFIIAFSDTRPPASGDADDIYFQMFDRFGNKTGVNQKVNDDGGITNQQRYPKIASNISNNFLIAWSDNRDSFNSTQFYAQSYNEIGVKKGINFRVYSSANDIGGLRLAMKNDGRYLIGWSEDIGSASKIFFQKFDSSDIRIGPKYLVSSEAPFSYKSYAEVNIFQDKIISVWNDTRNDPFDVYCNILSFTNPDTTVNIIQTSHLVPENFSLYQNYPNPFNPTTKINYELNVASYISLKVYDVLGNEIESLVNQKQNAGSYSVDWNATAFPSGVYFYKLVVSPSNSLQSGSFSETKRMLLIK